MNYYLYGTQPSALTPWSKHPAPIVLDPCAEVITHTSHVMHLLYWLSMHEHTNTCYIMLGIVDGFVSRRRCCNGPID
jgi:hypothetical protein